MIDIFALSVAHALLVLAAIRLMKRDELDREGETRPRFGKRTMTPLTRPDDSQAGPP